MKTVFPFTDITRCFPYVSALIFSEAEYGCFQGISRGLLSKKIKLVQSICTFERILLLWIFFALRIGIFG